MSHWKLTLSYNGSSFHGWQIQPGLVTVQGQLAEALKSITGEDVLPQGSGRTDAGVHALAQVASFALRTEIPAANLHRALNRILPPSIRVDCVEIVEPGFHARHSSRRKTYEYRIFERRPALREAEHASAEAHERICSPFLAPFVWDCRWPLDLNRLRQAAALLVGTHDFTAMAASARELKSSLDGNPVRTANHPNPVKTIFRSGWSEAGGLLVYRVTGSGFLHHMVRNLVGTMVDIGRGSLDVDDLPRILRSRNRAEAGPTAPASGLYLVEVDFRDGADAREVLAACEEVDAREQQQARAPVAQRPVQPGEPPPAPSGQDVRV